DLGEAGAWRYREAVRAEVNARAANRRPVSVGWSNDCSPLPAVLARGFALASASLQRTVGGKVIRQAKAVRMFDDGNFISLKVPDRMARAVRERITRTPVANGSMRAA
ncbi:MAG: hypothetical protein V4472_25695, partial [Pseudomonadota bacterium]